MTPRQRCLYWREWAAVQRARPDADRHALHVEALGRPRSSKEFNNEDLDKVLATFRAISRPVDLDGQLRQIDQPRRRLLWKIEVELCGQLALYVEDAEQYILAVVADKFHARHLRQLTNGQLEQLRFTLARAIDRHRSAAGHTVAEMQRLAAALAVQNTHAPGIEEVMA